ncbi:MAG: hypothetical protein H0V13_07445 [Nocardioidaceae bacterium]|nr:hypothetical protein [Nocardioidaceae bacterium]
MLVESWRHLEGRIRVSIMSHDATQLPGIMSEHRHATIVDAIEKGGMVKTCGSAVVGQFGSA